MIIYIFQVSTQDVNFNFCFFTRWKVQRIFTLKFMRKLGMSKLKQTENSKMEQKISVCLNLLLEGKHVFILLLFVCKL